ncbi:hypothetical protein [Epibacterium ulvae]|uniref:hypothetical protein n=1 Tax=Epibacterium ulvae TaxID=1156985 RepID=UPI0024909AEC|nr:hypothetical protein [Epibacterium ulvae]
MGQVAHTFQVIEGGSFDVLPELSKEPTKEPQRNLEKWLPSEVVVSLAGVSDRMVGKALATCTWRGCDLLVREEQTGRGRGGKTLQVHVDSLPADLREAWYLERGIVLHAKPDTQTGHTLLVPEQAYQNDAKFEADLELARWRHDVIRPLLLLDRQSAGRTCRADRGVDPCRARI